jgi:hypothetical protein
MYIYSAVKKEFENMNVVNWILDQNISSFLGILKWAISENYS